MRIKKSSIFLQLTYNSLGIIIIILLVYSGAQYSILNQFSNGYEKEQIISRYNEVKVLGQMFVLEELTAYLDQCTHEREYIRIYNQDTEVYHTEGEIWGVIPYSIEEAVSKKIVRYQDYSIMTGAIHIKDDLYVIQIVQNIDLYDAFIERSLPMLFLIAILTIALSIGGAVYVSRYFLKRLELLVQAMKAIKAKGIHQRVAVSEVNDEFDKMNHVFNEMMDEVERGFEEQRRFVSDASHELKTPLTALAGHLNMLRRWGKNDKERLEKSLEICVQEVERLKKIVQDMLLLSKLEGRNTEKIPREALAIEPIIEETLNHYSILNPQMHYKLSIEEGLTLAIREEDLKQLLVIVIDNAIKYNDKDSPIIAIKAYNNRSKVCICIKDNGMGISAEALSQVKNRFYKVDKSRVNNQSSGLGLSIADQLLKTYNAELTITSEFGAYTEVVITI